MCLLSRLAAVCIGVGALPAFAESGHKLSQTSDFLGKQTLWISKHCMKVTAPSYGITFVTTAPGFKLLGYNDHSKTYYLEDYGAWHNQLAQLGTGVQTERRKLAASETLAGMKSKRWVLQAYHSDRYGKQFGDQLYNTELVVTDEIKVPPQFTEMFTLTSNVPNDMGFPLQIIRHTMMGKRAIIYSTDRIEKTDVPVKMNIPSGYTRVDSEMALFTGEGANTELAHVMAGNGLSARTMSPPKTRLTESDHWAPSVDRDGDITLGLVETRSKTSRQRSGYWAPGWNRYDNPEPVLPTPR